MQIIVCHKTFTDIETWTWWKHDLEHYHSNFTAEATPCLLCIHFCLQAVTWCSCTPELWMQSFSLSWLCLHFDKHIFHEYVWMLWFLNHLHFGRMQSCKDKDFFYFFFFSGEERMTVVWDSTFGLPSYVALVGLVSLTTYLLSILWSMGTTVKSLLQRSG